MLKLKWFCKCGTQSTSIGNSHEWVKRRAKAYCPNLECGEKLNSFTTPCVIDDLRPREDDPFKILVVGRSETESFWFHNNIHNILPDSGKHIWISAHDTDSEEPHLPLSKHRVDHLVQAYDDIEFMEEGFTPMSLDQGIELLEFVNDHKDDVTTIIVNCEAGMCRSSATASVLSSALNGHDLGISKSDWFLPNTWVYQCLYSMVGILDGSRRTTQDEHHKARSF
jgi:predicted protein tyrosine phosphatase